VKRLISGSLFEFKERFRSLVKNKLTDESSLFLKKVKEFLSEHK